jgi:hypothetical protein
MAWNDHQYSTTEIHGTFFIIAQGNSEIHGSFNLVPLEVSLVLRASVVAEAQYLPRYSPVEGFPDLYELDEEGLYVEDPDNPGTYILMSEHPSEGKYPTYLEVLAGSGVDVTNED